MRFSDLSYEEHAVKKEKKMLRGDQGGTKCVQHSPRRMQIQVASWELVSSAGKEILCLHGGFISHPWLNRGIYSPKNSYFPWIHPITCVLGAPALTPPLNHPLKIHQSQILDTFFFPFLGKSQAAKEPPASPES